MATSLVGVVAAACLLASSTLSYAGCSPALSEQVLSAQRVVDSLRPDKPGQLRVFASDGSQYTAAEVLWMKGQLRLVSRGCTRGDDVPAASALRRVTDVLNAHHRAS